MSLAENPAIALRRDLINGQFDLEPGTTDFMRGAREELARAAKTIVDALPANADIGRVIAFLDKLQDAKDAVCAAAVIGSEAAVRAEKKRKSLE